MNKKNIIEIDGVSFPKGIKSPHQKFIAQSPEYKEYMETMLRTLSDWHSYAEENNILYSLSGGSLMGYFWNKSIMPWDDDIDVMVSEDSFFKLKNSLWEGGESIGDYPRFKNSEGAVKRWGKHNKFININGSKYLLSTWSLKPKFRAGTKELIKILQTENLNANYLKGFEMGGLDIGACRIKETGKTQELFKQQKPCCGPTNNFDKSDCPIVSFSGIETRAVKREIAEPILTSIYGAKWIIPKHPKIK